jgi:hypothetical protein
LTSPTLGVPDPDQAKTKLPRQLQICEWSSYLSPWRNYRRLALLAALHLVAELLALVGTSHHGVRQWACGFATRPMQETYVNCRTAARPQQVAASERGNAVAKTAL